jgi:peroxiredoxin Q/BCP
MSEMPETGQAAPDFELPDDTGTPRRLSAQRGKWTVLYFYPKDNTPGCTTEAIGFTARLAEFEAANTAVIGISKDSVKSHERFCRKHGLGMPLLSDEAGVVVERFGVWGEKSMYGRSFMGIDRSTFLVDAHGIVTRVWRKVSVPEHVDEVLAAAQALA